MDLQTEMAGITLEHPLMNAAGTCKTLEDVKKLSRSASAAIMLGSVTMEPRMGNSGDVYWLGPTFSLNSLGLPNRGIDYYEKVMPEMVTIAHGEGKPLWVSVAGFSPLEYTEMTERIFNAGGDLVELNLGCPNLWTDGVQKRIVSFDLDLIAEALMRVEDRVGPGAKVSVKLSPYSDPFLLSKVAAVVGMFQLSKAVTTSNAFPNAVEVVMGKPSILAGLGGPAMKPIVLGQVRQLGSSLRKGIDIIGVGGITSGRDIADYISCGAKVVQVATAYLERGEQVFSTLLSELLEHE